MNHPDIYKYIESQEASFQTEEIQVGDNWMWNFRNHVQLIFHLKNGVFFTGENNWLRAFKNIMDPLLNLAYWTEDIEVKDVVFYIEQQGGRVLSFLVKKYHDEVYVKENNLDTLFDEITESDLDYGGVLVQPTNNARPEVLQLNQIAFCDQTDILGGPLGFKHNFNPDKLRAMSKVGWGKKENGATVTLEELITLADPYEKAPEGMLETKKNRVTGKNIEVYLVYGSLQEHYLKDNDNTEDYYEQIQIVAFYLDKKGKRNGVTLYRKKQGDSKLKFHTSKKVFGRALGRGEGEALLHPQIWTNFLTIHKTALLESASKVPLFTDDESYTQKNKIQDMENLEITTISSDSKYGIRQIPTASPANLQLISGAINEWYEHGQLSGSAFDPIMGKEASSGTTFRGQERSVAQGRGLHERRRGQRAKFIEEIYRDDIIPKMVKEIVKGKKFLATLTAKEMKWVSEQLSINYANRAIIDDVINKREPRDIEVLKQEFLKNFSREGNQHLIEILKDEFDGIEIKMGINIAGKQKDLVGLTDKVLSIFQYIFANPQGFQQAMQIPGMAESFQDILEYSGINSVDFSTMASMPMALPMAQPEMMQPEAGQTMLPAQNMV